VILIAVAALAAAALPHAQARERLRDRFLGRRAAAEAEQTGEAVTLGGRQTQIWAPQGGGPAPLILFSHGLGGCETQSTFLTQGLAEAGYVVVGVRHADARCGQQSRSGRAAPEERLRDA
jgi:predicted dienelactone hydrolase